MKYALLIYAAPGASQLSDAEAREAWMAYARAAKDAGVLLGAERLTATVRAAGRRPGHRHGRVLDTGIHWPPRPSAAASVASPHNFPVSFGIRAHGAR